MGGEKKVAKELTAATSVIAMGEMSAKYGSELHLLRFLGRHRHALHKHIEAVLPGRVIDWIDFNFDSKKLDAEWLGLDFIADYLPAKKKWEAYWPQTGKVQNWDAIGWIDTNSHAELLLVEAKAHVAELRSETKASEKRGLPIIRAAFDQTKIALKVPAVTDWLQPYYQYCNRLATLHFLTEHGIGARLLFVYFCGDTAPGTISPKTQAEWMPHLTLMYQHIGLSGSSELEKRVHNVFIPIKS